MMDEDSVTIPVEAVKDKTRLIKDLENHACHILRMAMTDDFVEFTIDKKGAIEVAASILQLISIAKSSKGQA